MSKRLEILKASLIKKKAVLDDRFERHFSTVKQANGQPLNDKRNGQATINKWEKQNTAIRYQLASIEKTEQAIEIEEGKIAGVKSITATLPTVILEMLETGQLTQWRRYPNTFFVRGVDKARIVWDSKKGTVFTRYRNTIKEQEVWQLFVLAANKIALNLKN